MYVHIIDRGDLEEVVAIGFDKEGKRVEVTRRADLARSLYLRSDIVLVNATRSGSEYVVYATADDPDERDPRIGFTGDLEVLDWLTDDQYATVLDIANRMRTNAREFQPACKLLRT